MGWVEEGVPWGGVALGGVGGMDSRQPSRSDGAGTLYGDVYGADAQYSTGILASVM